MFDIIRTLIEMNFLQMYHIFRILVQNKLNSKISKNVSSQYTQV